MFGVPVRGTERKAMIVDWDGAKVKGIVVYPEATVYARMGVCSPVHAS